MSPLSWLGNIRTLKTNPVWGGGWGTGKEWRSLFSMFCINHPIYPLGTISFFFFFKVLLWMEWFITMLRCGVGMPISTKMWEKNNKRNQLGSPSKRGCSGDSSIFQWMQKSDSIPEPTLSQHLSLEVCLWLAPLRPFPTLEIPAKAVSCREPCLEEEARRHPGSNHLCPPGS